jgi:hypothetical protein
LYARAGLTPWPDAQRWPVVSRSSFPKLRQSPRSPGSLSRIGDAPQGVRLEEHNEISALPASGVSDLANEVMHAAQDFEIAVGLGS